MRLRNVLFFILSCFCLVYITGCVAPQAGTEAKVTSGQGSPNIQEAQMEAYDGPKARVAVTRFKNKAGGHWYSHPIGDGMADQMTTALFNTNRYIVLERETLDDVLAEQDLGASGRIKKGTAAKIGEIEGAELLIVGAVTEFSGNASGGGGGLGGFGGGIFGAISGGFKKAHMAIDVRVIDAQTSRILAATSVEGEATDVNLGGLIGGYGGSGALAAGLGGWKNTPMEKAMRICIQKAVEFIAAKTPQRYYRHGSQSSSSGGTTIQQSAPAPASAPAGSTGLTRDVVRKMQSYLASLGYPVGKPDGIAGKNTRKAIRSFQQDYGLEVTGEFDPPTMKKLREVAGD